MTDTILLILTGISCSVVMLCLLKQGKSSFDQWICLLGRLSWLCVVSIWLGLPVYDVCLCKAAFTTLIFSDFSRTMFSALFIAWLLASPVVFLIRSILFDSLRDIMIVGKISTFYHYESISSFNMKTSGHLESMMTLKADPVILFICFGPNTKRNQKKDIIKNVWTGLHRFARNGILQQSAS